MDEKYIFLKPTFSTAIWGDGSLVHHYHVEKYVPKDMNIDEITGLGAFCGLPQDANEIMNGKYKGRKLNELYDEHPEMFGTPSTLRWEHIPVSMGIGHACTDLSIEVHPTEEYALKNLGCHGKSESWYIVNCPHNADIVMGHNAKTIQELDEYIQNKDWKGLLKRYPIFPGAFYNIQAGTLHAIQKGTTFMEVCNPCPVTYRFYDYDRLDKQGKPRQLDVEKAKDNILVPFECQDTHYSYRNHQGVTEIKLTDNKNFSVYKYVINGSGELTMPKPYLGAFVIEGQGQIEDVKLQAGDSFLISANVKKLMWKGEMTVLAYYG